MLIQGRKPEEQEKHLAEAKFPCWALICNLTALPYISTKEPALGEYFVNSSLNIKYLVYFKHIVCFMQCSLLEICFNASRILKCWKIKYSKDSSLIQHVCMFKKKPMEH